MLTKMPHTLPLHSIYLFHFQSGFTQVRAINPCPCCLFACALVFGELCSLSLTGGSFTFTSKGSMGQTLFLLALKLLSHALSISERLKASNLDGSLGFIPRLNVG